jgi:hypothetical protein
MRSIRLILVVLALSLGMHLYAFGQAVTTTLVGTVSDAAKASIAKAEVKITEQSTGASTTQTTNESGNYQFTFLPPGVYTVTVAVQGFQTQTTKDVSAPVNVTARLDVSLQPGSVSDSITVTDSAPLLQTDRSDVSTQFETKQVEDLPLGANRNFQGLQSLVPGIGTPIYDHSAFFDSQNSMSFHANGQSELVNNLQVEGIDDNQRGGLLQVYIPPAAAIQTVDVETANYAPEFGRAGGAVTNVSMKSGTNRFHGSAYAYNGVSKTAARTYFNRTGIFPRYTNNYDGGTFGGPIFKNRTFIFGDFLRYSNISSVFSLFSVPSAAFRTGDLRASPTPIYDPNTGTVDPVTGVPTGRTQFVSDGSNLAQGIPIGTPNVIPQSRLAVIPQSVLALIPQPNIPGAGNTNNFQESVVLSQISKTFDLKLDQNVRERDHFTARYSREIVGTNQHPAFGNAGGPSAGGYEGIGTDTTWVAAAEYTHIFSPTLFAEGRVGVSYFNNVQQPSDYGINTATALGIPNINNGLTSSGVPNFTINGYSAPIVGYQAFIPETDPQTNTDGVLNVTKVLGNHSLKFGAENRAIRDDITQGQVFGTRGAYVYADGQTGTVGVKTSYGNDMASFLLDKISSAGIDVNVGDASFRQKLYFLFAQDTWQATSKLTLTYGLRWEYYAPPSPKVKGGFSQYNPADNTLSVAGYGGVPLDLGVTKNLKNFQPRVGFAYRANPTLVIRAGFGVASSPFPDKFYAYNYPVKQNISFQPISSYVAAPITLAAGFPTAAQPAIPANGIIPSPSRTSTLNNSSWVTINTNYHDPTVASYNLTVEQSLGHNWVATIAYVGNEGRHIPGNFNLNAGTKIGGGAGGQPEFVTFGRTAATELLPKGTSGNYNSLQARVEHRFASGFTWLSTFAWQKSMGFNSTGGGLGGYNFYIDPHRDYAPLAWDTRNTYAESFVYELPFGRNKMMLTHGIASALAGGWQVSSLLGMQTGTPLFFSASSTALNAPGTTQTPNQVGPFRKLRNIGAGRNWFDITSFAAPPNVMVGTVPTPTQGNVGKNVYSGPGQVQFNASVFRSFPIHDALSFQLRVDALNALNHPTFANPSTDMTSSSFGQITATSGSAAAGNNAAPGRTLQLAGTISF